MESMLDSSTYVDAAINQQLTKDDKTRLLWDMVRIRRFEQAALKYYNLGRMGAFSTCTLDRKLSQLAPSRFWVRTIT